MENILTSLSKGSAFNLLKSIQVMSWNEESPGDTHRAVGRLTVSVAHLCTGNLSNGEMERSRERGGCI